VCDPLARFRGWGHKGLIDNLLTWGDTLQKNEQQEVADLRPAAAEGTLLYCVEPEHSEETWRQRIQGPVVLEVHIGAMGMVDYVQVVSRPPLLPQAATAAVKQWRFQPRTQDGQVVGMQNRIPMNFQLPQ